MDSNSDESTFNTQDGREGLPPQQSPRLIAFPDPERLSGATPITGRVSRARKGVPVFTCDMCNPPKARAPPLR